VASDRTANVTVSPLTDPQARMVAEWRYDPPYDLYDGAEAEVAVMLDPANQYHAVHVEAEFVGYVCVGPDARVTGLEEREDVDDIGLGFRPDLTGQGIASAWIPTVIALLADRLNAPMQRVVITAWNKRSQAVARRAGFGQPTPHVNGDGEWIVLSRHALRGI
jgi:ribosomal-protein-alanine N-acetyltransferase